jgi:hypothetical protein
MTGEELRISSDGFRMSSDGFRTVMFFPFTS